MHRGQKQQAPPTTLPEWVQKWLDEGRDLLTLVTWFEKILGIETHSCYNTWPGYLSECPGLVQLRSMGPTAVGIMIIPRACPEGEDCPEGTRPVVRLRFECEYGMSPITAKLGGTDGDPLDAYANCRRLEVPDGQGKKVYTTSEEMQTVKTVQFSLRRRRKGKPQKDRNKSASEEEKARAAYEDACNLEIPQSDSEFSKEGRSYLRELTRQLQSVLFTQASRVPDVRVYKLYNRANQLIWEDFCTVAVNSTEAIAILKKHGIEPGEHNQQNRV